MNLHCFWYYVKKWSTFHIASANISAASGEYSTNCDTVSLWMIQKMVYQHRGFRLTPPRLLFRRTIVPLFYQLISCCMIPLFSITIRPTGPIFSIPRIWISHWSMPGSSQILVFTIAALLLPFQMVLSFICQRSTGMEFLTSPIFNIQEGWPFHWQQWKQTKALRKIKQM